MTVEINESEDIFKAFKIIFDSLINFGLFESIFIFFNILLDISSNLLNVSQIHISSDKAFNHFVVKKYVNKFKVNFFFQI